MIVEIAGIELALHENESLLGKKASDALSIGPEEVKSLKVVRKSLDARRSRPPRFICTVQVEIGDEHLHLHDTGDRRVNPVCESPDPGMLPALRPRAKKIFGAIPVVVGSGPAGLFAALMLARAGLPCLLLEQGKAIAERVRDVEDFRAGGRFNPESNIHFGEGGAGTFSDGKLTTRVRNPYISFVKNFFVEMGAPREIAYSARPHIGTDRLRALVENFRGELRRLGCEIRFGAKVTGLVLHKGRIEGVIVNGLSEIRTRSVVLATGQGSVETYRMLDSHGVRMTPKAFAIGVRVEHPQELINKIQYGRWWREPALPPAEYSLAVRVSETGHSAYTFCMCPGGEVVCCSSAEGEVVTNGMSYSRRDGSCANSAVVVNVSPEDFPGESPLEGLYYRGTWERKAFALGGNSYFAPAQKLVEFLKGENGAVRESTYKPGITPARINDALPSYVARTLRHGFLQFEEKMPGYISAEALMIGVETRTSSPVRVLRGPDLQSVSASGLYPCGEGAGYAGGIMSSALDGIRAAEALLDSLEG